MPYPSTTFEIFSNSFFASDGEATVLVSVEYTFIALTLRFTLTSRDRTSYIVLFLFNALFNVKAILLEEQQLCYLTHRWEDKLGGGHAFPQGM